jgi:YD repeat-containing protein
MAELLVSNLLASIEAQGRLAETIGDKPWSVDVAGGTLSFADGPSYRTDLVGSAAADPGTWLWAWANQHLPEGVGATSDRLRRYGREHSIDLLTTPSMPLSDPPDGIDPHLAGLLATPLLDGDAYFLAQNGPQTVVLVLHDPSLRPGPLTGADLRTTVMSGIGMYGTDHRAAILAYLNQRGAELTEDGGEWAVRTADGQESRVTFDDQGRLAGITATLSPEEPPEPKRRRFWRR